jgi:GGDEF domain-containing protein
MPKRGKQNNFMQPERPELKPASEEVRFSTAEELLTVHRNKVDGLVMENPPREDATSIAEHFKALHSLGEQDYKALLAIYEELRILHLEERWLRLKTLEVNRSLKNQNAQLVALHSYKLNGDKVAQIIIERLSDLASKDQLTGLLNRRGFEQVVEHCQKEGVSGVLVMLDLDKFKAVNDAYGHQVGDLALMAAANYLNEISGSVSVITKMRSSNTSSDKGAVGHRVRRQADRQPQTGRLGGEELAIFIPNMTAKELEEFLKEKSGSNDVAKIQAPLGFKFSELPVLPGKDRPDRPDGYVSFSGGIIDLKPNMPLSEALTRIDTTLYKAKEDGRDRVLIAE